MLSGGSHSFPWSRPGASLGFSQGVGPDRRCGHRPAKRGIWPAISRRWGRLLGGCPRRAGERPQGEPEPEPAYEVREPTPEEKLRQAQSTPCPIAKYSGKTLGEVLTLDPKAILWVANKFTGNQDISAAAKYLCDYALEQAAG